MLKSILFAVVLLVGLATSLVEAAIPSGASNATTAPVMRLRINTEPATLDWNRIFDPITSRLMSQTMEGLLQRDEKLAPVPGLAKSWDISKDGTTYVFHLRDGVKWSDGVELTAQQFVDSWLRVLDPKLAAVGAELLGDVVGAKAFNKGQLTDASKVGVRALDAKTLEVRLLQPASYFLGILPYVCLSPVRLDLIAKYGKDWTDPANLVVLGPYRLTEWKRGTKFSFVRNESYYGKKPGLPAFDFVVVEEDSTAVNLFESGMLDFVPNIPTSDLGRFKNSDQFHIEPVVRVAGYRFNPNMKPFDDVRVRLALAHAVEKTQFAKLLGGGQVGLNGWVPKGVPGYESKAGLPFDPTRARKLLSEAGFPGGKGFPRITAYFDSRDDNKLVAERLQAIWKEILNIDIEFKGEEFATNVGHLIRNPPALYKFGYGMIYLDPHDILRESGPSGRRCAGWKNDEYDRILLKAPQISDRQARNKMYEELERILIEKEAILIPIVQETLPYLLSPRVKKFGFHKGIYFMRDTSIE